MPDIVPSDNQPSSPCAGFFAWPPARADEGLACAHARAHAAIDPCDLPPPSAPAQIAVPSHASPATGWWGQVERVWLDLAAAPLLERAAEAGWVPDGPDAYCRRCGRTVPNGRPVDTSGCPACREHSLPWDRFIRLGSYEPPLSRWIRDIKFTRWRRLGFDLGRWLGEAVAAELERTRVMDPGAATSGQPLIVPVPMSLGRRLVRGIDHSHIIAQGVAATSGGRVVRGLRRESRASQLHVPASQRAANLRGAFHPRRAVQAPDVASRVVLVDDVSTTGATLRAACQALRKSWSQHVSGETPQKRRSARDSQIWVAVLGRTPEHIDDRVIT